MAVSHRGRAAGVAEAARALIERRTEISREEQIGLTELYNRVDDGAYTDLMKLHRRLDEAVARAYHWPMSVAGDTSEALKRLGSLNQEIGGGAGNYEPFS